ncbi:MAG: CHRD domain-containing protein [Vulcanimicrobiaceae bacterium]
MYLSRSILTSLALVALAGTFASAQGTMNNAKMTMGKSVTVQLKPENNSGETGTATLTQEGSNVLVKVSLTGAPKTAQPAHIHEGTCAKLNPAPKYPLSSVVDGKSTTVVKDVKLSELTSGSYAINVHKSTEDLKTYVACGDIK